MGVYVYVGSDAAGLPSSNRRENEGGKEGVVSIVPRTCVS